MKSQNQRCKSSGKKSDSFKQTIYLLRHGETDANVQNIYQGLKYDPPLNENGRGQILKLAEFLKKKAGDTKIIYTSPLRRTLDTMVIIAHHLSNPENRDLDGHVLPKMIIERGLYEIDHGAWDGKTVEDVKQIWPQVFEMWQYGDQNLVEFPCGESVVKARKRIWAGFQNILENDSGEKVIIVSHGGTNALILTSILKTSFFRPIRQSNACVNIIERTVENNMDDFKIVLINGTGHLE